MISFLSVYNLTPTKEFLFLFHKVPDAQVPLIVPPLELHSVVVKQVPIIVVVAVDMLEIHWLKNNQ